MTQSNVTRIPEEQLAQQWFGFLQKIIGELQQDFREEQKKNGPPQKDIAIRIGKDAGFVSRCLSGQQNMTMRTLHNLARGMDYRLDVHLAGLDRVQPRNWQEAAQDRRRGPDKKREAQISNRGATPR